MLLSLGLLFLCTISGGRSLLVDVQPRTDHLATAKRVLRRVPLIDGHNDLAWHLMIDFEGRMSGWDLRQNMWNYFQARPEHPSQTDIPRIREGILGAQLWSAYSDCGSQYKDAVTKALRLIDLIKRFVTKYNDVFEFVTSADEILEAFHRGKMASLIGLEGGNMIDSSLAVLRMFYELGVRYMTLTWSCNNPWADNYKCTRENKPVLHGLSLFGERVVREMNRMGMLVDLSHVALDTMYDALNITAAPVIFSHSSAFAICPHRRNVPDDVLAMLKNNGGLIMVNVYPQFINCSLTTVYGHDNRTASVSQVADHFHHIKSITGPDHIGIGADFDGSDQVGEARDVSMYPYIFAELLARGWTEEELEKVAFRNFYRVLKTAEQLNIPARILHVIVLINILMVRDSKRGEAPDDTLIDLEEIPDKSCITTFWDS